MNYPIQPGWLLAIMVITGIPAIYLFLSVLWGLIPKTKKREDRYGNIRHHHIPPQFRLGSLGGSLVLAVIAFSAFTISGLVQEYLNLTGKMLVAHVRAVPVKNPGSNIPMLSVDLTLYDQNGQPTETTYVLNGDEVYIGGDIIQYKSWMNILGFHSGYKLTRIEGMYSDINLEEHAQHTVQVLNGGDDPSFLTQYKTGAYPVYVTSAYKNGSTVPTNGIGYNVCASQDAIVPQPDTEPC